MFSTFLEWLFKKIWGKDLVDHYLDISCLLAYVIQMIVLFLMHSFSMICEDLGVLFAADKSLGPSHILVYLGLEIDTLEICVKIPLEKLHVLRDLLLCFLGRKKITLIELQSLVGSLNFCARAILGSVAFNRCFYDASVGISNPRHHLRVAGAMKEDMDIWLMFLECFNGSVYFPESQWLDNDQLQRFTDSAGGSQLGCAAIFGTL